MELADNAELYGADIGLSMSERIFRLYKNQLDELHHGDKVQFNATILQMGDSFHLHHLHMFGIKKI